MNQYITGLSTLRDLLLQLTNKLHQNKIIHDYSKSARLHVHLRTHTSTCKHKNECTEMIIMVSHWLKSTQKLHTYQLSGTAEHKNKRSMVATEHALRVCQEKGLAQETTYF